MLVKQLICCLFVLCQDWNIFNWIIGHQRHNIAAVALYFHFLDIKIGPLVFVLEQFLN